MLFLFRDISFLYDVHKSQDKNEKPDAMDESTIRQEASDTGLFKSVRCPTVMQIIAADTCSCYAQTFLC